MLNKKKPMKPLIITLFTVCASIVFLAVCCNKDKEQPSIEKKISPLSITTESCGSNIKNEKSGNESDTVYSIRMGDTIVIRVEASYFCHYFGVDSLTAKNDSLNIFLTDTCTVYCHFSCWCPYAYKFIYQVSDSFPENYRLYIEDLFNKRYELKTEGELDLESKK